MSDLDALNLTDAERRYLAMHARYEASGQLDARRYVTGEIDENGALKLKPSWSTRQERYDRWRVIADALHPDPWEPLAVEPTTCEERTA